MGLLDRILGLFGLGTDAGDTPARDEPDESGGDEATDEVLAGLTAADGDAANLKGVVSEVNAAAEQVRERAADGGPEPPARFREEAAELVEFWPEHDLDFTPGSLRRLDALVDQQWGDGRFRDVEPSGGDGVHVDELAFRGIATRLGSYVGETLVRTHATAAWTDDEEFGWVVTVDGPDGEVRSNVFHVAGDCLREPSAFATSYETVVDEAGVDDAAPRS